MTETTMAEELESPEANPELSEVAIFIERAGDKINFFATTRDEPPDEDSPAVIFAAFLRSNLMGLFNAAMAGYASRQVITERQSFSILTADGNVARNDANLILPAGYAPVTQAAATNAASAEVVPVAGEPGTNELDLSSDAPLVVSIKLADGEGPCESCQ